MGDSASITKSGSTITVSGLTSIFPAAVGGTMTIYGAATSGNNGSFPVATYVSPSSVTITNASGATDANNGSIGWSLDWDTTAFIGSIDNKVSSATDLSTPDTNHGTYDISSSNPAIQGITDNDNTTIGNTLFTPGLPLTISGPTLYYKMVGFYTTGVVYESFVATGSPAASTCTNPNTGHTLVNTYVASFYSR